ncbi:MAG: putative porin [Calditrichaeota bacterium]|nr:putative porin [Calditrichota bacterium]MCB9365748.1 putative porin [Calditrichota bacterium]
MKIIHLHLLAALCVALLAPSAFSQSATDILSRTKLSGDFRFRYEFVEGKLVSTRRARPRIRYRLRTSTKVDERLTIGFGLTTSDNGSPRSPEVDLSGGLSPKSIYVERAYAEVKPCRDAKLLVGRHANVYEKTSLIWDSDVHLEGLSGIGTMKPTEKFEASLRGGWYMLEENSGGEDVQLLALQGTIEADEEDKLNLAFSLAYYDYLHIMGSEFLFDPRRSYGNSSLYATYDWPSTPDSAALYQYGTKFELVDALVRVGFPLGKLGVSLQANQVWNVANSPEKAWLVGADVEFPWFVKRASIGYDYRQIDGNAVVGAFTDSSPFGGQTAVQGHIVETVLPLTENIRFRYVFHAFDRWPSEVTNDYKGYVRHNLDFDFVIK